MDFQQNISKLEKSIEFFPKKTQLLSEEEWGEKSTPEKWSKKEVLGHLVDSALNNLQRYIRVQFEDEPRITYAQNDWVKAQNWQEISSEEIMLLWKGVNHQILNIWKNFPQEKLHAILNVSKEEDEFYSFLEMTADYLAHFYHHSKQIFPQTVTIIAAIAKNNALGKDNDLIWHLPADLKRFKKVTSGHHILMGRNTFESIGKPLPNRTTIIITRNKHYSKEGCLVANSIKQAIELATEDDEIFIIGGAQIYQQALADNLVDKLDITLVHQKFEADAFFPEIDKNIWEEVAREDFKPDDKNMYYFSFLSYKKKNIY